ncbi:hypothetical protein DICA3_F30262 [Diutina catenulata]
MYTFRISTCTIREIIKARDDVCESKSFSYITISIEVATLTPLNKTHENRGAIIPQSCKVQSTDLQITRISLHSLGNID